jgi:hypothetical protein
MAINQNHVWEDLDGIKCAIVEKNVRIERVEFLKGILTHNGFIPVAVPSPPPKTGVLPGSPPAAPVDGESPGLPAAPETFTVGVTDLTFNPNKAIFGRLLKTTDGHVVTLSFWQQKEKESRDEIPYFEAQH